MPLPVDPAYASWLKGEALWRGWSNSVLAGALAPMSIDSEIISPFAVAASVDTEILRQAIYLDGPLALDQVIIKGRRADLVGKSIILTDDQNFQQKPELIINGTFDSGTGSWVAAAQASLSNVSQKLRVTHTGTGANLGIASQTVTTIVGENYVFSGDLIANAGQAQIRVGTSLNSTAYGFAAQGAGTSQIGWPLAFVATSTSTWITVGMPNSTVNGDNADFDNLSLKWLKPVLVISAAEQDDGTTQLLVLRML